MKKIYNKPEMDVVFATPCHLMSPSKTAGGKVDDKDDDDYGKIGGGGDGSDMNDARRHVDLWDEWDEE